MDAITGKPNDSDEVELTIEDYREAWESAVRMAEKLPVEKRMEIQADFAVGHERAKAVINGSLDPLLA